MVATRNPGGDVHVTPVRFLLDEVVKVLKEQQQRTGVKLLWGTANLFSKNRFMHGAATSPNVDVFTFAAAQVKKALEVTHELGGEGYTFWAQIEPLAPASAQEVRDLQPRRCRGAGRGHGVESLPLHGQFLSLEPYPRKYR